MPRCAPGRLSTFVNAAGGATDTPVVAAVAGRKIRLIGFIVSPAAATPAASIVFNSKSGGAGTAISATFGLVAGVPITVEPGEQRAGLLETNIGEGLSVTTGAGAGGAGVHVIYEVVAP